jgi:hypothetical protein
MAVNAMLIFTCAKLSPIRIHGFFRNFFVPSRVRHEESIPVILAWIEGCLNALHLIVSD